MRHIHLHNLNWWLKIISWHGFKVDKVEDIRCGVPRFTFALFGYHKVNAIAGIDVRIADFVPKALASEWLIIARKDAKNHGD